MLKGNINLFINIAIITPIITYKILTPPSSPTFPIKDAAPTADTVVQIILYLY